MARCPTWRRNKYRGYLADARTDLFALGTILHEMATGRRAFEATTQASLIAKILETEPPVVSSLAPLSPPALDHVVQGCLAKAPADRWQTAHDVKMQLQWIQAQGSQAAPAPSATVPPRRAGWVPWIVATAGVSTALVATALLLSSRPATTQTPVRFDLILPSEMRQGDLSFGAISPDGQRFVFETSVNGRAQLVLRDMASTGLTVLSGTEGGFFPFWSSDSRSVAFFELHGQRVQLKRIPATGGPVRVIADAQVPATRHTPRRHVARRRDPVRDRGTHLPRPGHGRHAHRSGDGSVEARTKAIRLCAVASGWTSVAGHRGG